MQMSLFRRARAGCLALGLVLLPLGWANAGLFDDDEARKAILDLRARVDSQRESLEKTIQTLQRAFEESSEQSRRTAVQLQSQIDGLRAEIAGLRGQNEQLTRELAEQQRRHRDLAAATDERLRRLEPVKVSHDGRDFLAEPAEVREFEALVTTFRKGEFAQTQALAAEFLRRFPSSGYRFAASWWLGNAQYALRDHRNAIATLRSLVTQAPEHARAPEALLVIANSQIELKDNASARKTLDELVKGHPQSEAAVAAKERLARLR